MRDPQDTNTNAADSAPGVDDGKVRGDGPGIDARPGGRGLAWMIVGLALVILAVVFVARPQSTEERTEQAQLSALALPIDMTPAATPTP